MTPSDLPRAWRDEAARLRDRYGRPDLASLAEAHATELEEALRATEDEELTLTEAAQESGYATRTLREKIAKGEIENRGKKHRPRIRRADLPRSSAGTGGFDVDRHVAGIS